MSFATTCRLSTRHGTTLPRVARGSSLIARHQLVSRTSPLLPRLVNPSAIPIVTSCHRYSSSAPQLRTAGDIAQDSIFLRDSGNINEPCKVAVTQGPSSDVKRTLAAPIRRAEYELYHTFAPETTAKGEGSARTRTPPTLSQVWEVLAQIPTEVVHSPSFGISAMTHHLRKLAPFVPYVAGLLEQSLNDTSTEYKAEHTELARWCFLSSIFFGAPPIPSTPPTDPNLPPSHIRPSEPPMTDFDLGIRDIPRSQWPSKSARKDTHVFAQSKTEQAEVIAQCQRPYINMIRNSLNAGSAEHEHDLEAPERRSRAYASISETLVALDTGIQGISTSTKAKGRGHSLQGVVIHERALEPVIELVGLFPGSNARDLSEAGDGLSESIPEGIARVPRILQRMTMQDIRQKLQAQLRPRAEGVDYDAAVDTLLGGCLLGEGGDNLMYRLNRVTKSQTPGELLTLWELCSSNLRRNNQASEADSSSLRELQTRWLSAFLPTVFATIASEDPEAAKLKRVLQEIYAHLPRPTPLPVYHSLLGLYAGVATSPAKGQETTVSSEASLANLIATWARMRAEKVTPDLKAYMLLITGLGKKGDYQSLQQIWEELTRDAGCKALWQKEEPSSAAYPPMKVFNHFISTLFNLPTATGSAMLALALFQYLCDPKSPYEPDLFTMNTVLRHYARKKDIQAMMELIDRLPSFRLAPDLVTYTTLITGLLDAGKPHAAKGILDVMQKAKIAPNSYVYSLLIADLGRKGNSEAMASAEAIHEQMKQAGVRSTITTWTSLASGYFRANMIKEGLDTLKRAQAKGIKLDRVGYNMLFRSIIFTDSVPPAELDRILRGQTRQAEHSLGNATNTEAALFLLRNMIDSHVEPDTDTWFIILDGLVRQEKWSEGEVVIRLMRSRGFVVKEGSALARVTQQIRNREQRRRR